MLCYSVMVTNPEGTLYTAEMLSPGTIIRLDGLMGFTAIETSIVTLVEPNHDIHAWQAELPVKSLLSPRINNQRFIGSFIDSSLEVMAEPYKRLLDCRERGFTMPLRTYPRTNARSLVAAERAVGLIFRSNLYSRSLLIGSTVSEMFYLPLPRSARYGGDALSCLVPRLSDSPRTSPVRVNNTRRALSRYVTNPRYDKTPLVADGVQAERNG